MKLTRRGTLSGMAATAAVLAAPMRVRAATGEINVMLFAQPYTQGLRNIAADFEKETGIRANVDVVGQDVFESRINLTFTGGTGEVDVVHVPAIQAQKWREASWIRPVDDYLDALTSRSDLLKGPMDSYLVAGQQWGVPFAAGVGMMAYRKDLLDRVGSGAPDTWADMLAVAKQIHSDDVAAVALRAAPGQGFNMFIFPMFMRAYGGKFFADYVGGDLTPAVNSPENLEALKIYIDLLNNYGPQGVGTFNFPEITASMQNGQVAMTIEGSGVVSLIIDPATSKYADQMGIAVPPGGPAGRSPAIAVHGMGIPASSRNPDGAARFISWATSTETVRKIALNEPFIDFVNGSLARDKDLVTKYGNIQPDLLNVRVAALEQTIGHYRPLLPNWDEIGAAIGENVNGALNGLYSPEDALEAAQDEMEMLASF
ncbi:sugar ABC transporter substrate-binding protein [Falsirhodobacter sp. alg1]|uniref:ABC transporter substrate-binding protein n=1 Tax=Falsirhodobacter sp. alg1 TaxID=1472418 RepID=UPI00128E9BF0|nr:sugar ABC transporter substrate-binding protein [Falsirhodobacter sp. alg1]